MKAAEDLKILDIATPAFPSRNHVIHLQLVARLTKAAIGVTLATGFIALKYKAANCATDPLALTRLNFHRCLHMHLAPVPPRGSVLKWQNIRRIRWISRRCSPPRLAAAPFFLISDLVQIGHVKSVVEKSIGGSLGDVLRVQNAGARFLLPAERFFMGVIFR